MATFFPNFGKIYGPPASMGKISCWLASCPIQEFDISEITKELKRVLRMKGAQKVFFPVQKKGLPTPEKSVCGWP